MVNNDITDNIQLICPSNNYSDSYFDGNKKTLILFKQGKYYEPIYSLEDKGKVYELTRRFSLKYKNILPNIKHTLELIKKTYNEKCNPLPSIPQIYKFKTNLILSKIVKLLKSKDYTILEQVFNYNGKVIGIIVKKNDKEGYIPCYPSSLIIDLTESYKWMDDEIGYSYEDTLEFLKYTYELFDGKIPCKPKIKIINDGLIVGILTETNQFVPLNEPEQNIYEDELIEQKGTDYIVRDKIMLTSDKLDNERINTINRIKLENKFFIAFRNTLRSILNKFENINIKREIETIITSPNKLYLEKLEKIDKLLKKNGKNIIEFSNYEKSKLDKLNDVTNCNLIDNCKDKEYCKLKKENCILVIPKTNLINGKDNENIYYGRVSDELIRYNRIRSYFFEPKMFMAFRDINYDLNENEIILLQSLLRQEYLDETIVTIDNKYVNFNTYDTSEPLKSQTYSNEIDMTKKDKEVKEEEICEVASEITITGKWKKVFPENSSEMKFTYSDDNKNCSFELIKKLIINNDKLQNKITLLEIKENLLKEYIKLFDIYPNELVKVLNSQGKKLVSKQIGLGQAKLSNVIMSDEYYLTNLDIWILSILYKIPIILYSSTTLIENGEQILKLNDSENDSFYFIKSPGILPDKNPIYKLVTIDKEIKKIALSSLSNEYERKIDEFKKVNLYEFLKDFKLIKKRKPKLKLVEEIKPKRKLKLVEKL